MSFKFPLVSIGFPLDIRKHNIIKISYYCIELTKYLNFVKISQHINVRIYKQKISGSNCERFHENTALLDFETEISCVLDKLISQYYI